MTDDRVPALKELDSPPWDDPLPLGWAPSALPEFPADALPHPFGQFVTALAEDTQTPADIPGPIILGAISAAIGGRVVVQPRRNWREHVNLFVVPIAPPGSRKSAVVSAVTRPLHDAESHLLTTLGPGIRDARVRHDVLCRRAERAKVDAVKDGDAKSIADAVSAEKHADEASPPAFPRLIVQDATPEVLVSRLAEQGGRIAGISAEAGIFESFTGRYGKSPNLDFILQAHANDTILVDRNGREPERIDEPALTIVASIQPFALRTMLRRDDFAGRGLLARPQWAIAKDNVGFRKIEPNPIPEKLETDYQERLKTLAVNAYQQTARRTLTVGPVARETLVAFQREVELSLRPTAKFGAPLIRGWASKLVGAMLRIAGCIHVAAKEGGDVISGDTMASAVRLARYFAAHAVVALESDDGEARRARTVLDALIERVGPRADDGQFRLRDAQRAMPRGDLQSAETLKRTFDALVQGGWIRPVPNGKKGMFEVRPDASELLKAADSADSADTDPVLPGQQQFDDVSAGADRC